MRLYIFLLILSAFFQTSFVPLNLCLIIIICRSFILSKQSNFFIAFLIGIILGVLASQNLGFWALVFVIITKVSNATKKLPVSSNIFTIIPVIFVLLMLVSLLENLSFKTPINLLKIIIESLLGLPIFYFFKLWEERFVLKSDLRLKIRN